MFPWFWIWAPHLQFPLSGNVSQDIEPVASLFSGATDAEAGDPRIEQKAFDVASYGKQLGLITEVLIEIAEQSLPNNGDANESLRRLKCIRAEIERVKSLEYDVQMKDLERTVKAIRRRGGPKSKALSAMLSEVQAGSDG